MGMMTARFLIERLMDRTEQNPHGYQRNRLIIAASWMGIILNALLAAAKITVGLLDNSFAVISDGVDSGLDILTSLITLFAAKLMMRPPDKQFPYGYSRIDPLATKVFSFILFFSGIQLVVTGGKNLIEIFSTGQITASGSLPGASALGITIVSIIIKALLAWHKIGLGRRIDSSMLIADGKNMRLDIITSLVVLFSLLLSRLTGLIIIDAITGILVSLWIMRAAVSIFLDTNVELMDGMSDTDVYAQILKAANMVSGLHNPHRIRVRRLGHLLLVVMDIEVAPDMTIAQAHEVSLEAEGLIRQRVDNVYDVIIHIEPLGLKEDETFGLSSDSL